MKKEQQEKKIVRILFSVWKYIVFFLLISFVVTCSMLLFFDGMDVPEEIARANSLITFVNIIFLSFIFSLLDSIRRKYKVERPLKQILDATHQITEGDFRVRIEHGDSFGGKNEFDVIIENLNKMAEELSGIETLRTDFIANVSHELKTPLSVIYSYATMLQNTELPSHKRMEYAKTITEASRRLSDLITNILKLSKLENQQIYPDTQKYNLSEQLCECLLGFENIWEKKGLEIKTDIDEDVMVKADAELLTLVWNNLFSNAMKFTEDNGKVIVALKAEDEFALVRVSDDGCGISPEIGQHIFEKFYQGDKSHSMQGNGLGLALVKRVIDIMGGEIFVESALGRGSTFTVKLRRESNATI